MLCCAATMVRERAPEAEFVVVGDGPERQSYAARSECAPVRFVGISQTPPPCSGPSTSSRCHRAGRDSGGSRSRRVAGVAVIAADVGGLSEVVDDTGLLVPSEQPEPLAEAILELAHNPAQRRSLAAIGRRRALEQFHAQRMLEQIQALSRSFIR